MKIVNINTIEIQVNDEIIAEMMERITMEQNREILIRNKHDALKLSKKTLEYLESSRKERFLEAVKDGDKIYLNSIYESLSMTDLIKLLCRKVKKRIQLN